MKSIWKIFKLSKNQHKLILIACVLITIQAVLQQATPITLKCVVDELSKQISNGSGDYQKLTYFFGLILTVSLFTTLLNFSSHQKLTG